MKAPRRSWDTGTRAAAGAALIAIAALFGAAGGAYHIEQPAPTSIRMATASIVPERTMPPGNRTVADAIRRNPFSPDRRPPAERFRLQDTSTDEIAPEAHTYSGPPPTLSGIARAGSAALVLAAYPGEESRILRPGEQIGEWLLLRVEDNRAAFRNDLGQIVEVEMPNR